MSFDVLTFVLYLFIKCSEGSGELVATQSDDIGTFWQLTDIHLERVEPGGSVNTYLNESTACQFPLSGSSCDTPMSLLLSACKAAQSISSQPDFILWTGDTGPHMGSNHSQPVSNLTLLNLLSNVTATLRQCFPSQRSLLIPVLGQYDVSPPGQMLAPSQADGDISWCATLARRVWRNELQEFREYDAFGNFSRGCYYAVRRPKSRTLLLVLNTVLWSASNAAVLPADQPDPAGQFAWLEGSLEQARKDQLRVLLVGHIPPGACELLDSRHCPHLRAEYATRLLHMIRDNADVLEAAVFGGLHTDSFRLLLDANTGASLVPMFLAPSLSPRPLPELGSPNPSMRLFFYSRGSTSQPPRLLDYEQYLANVRDNVWSLEYRAGDVYLSHVPQQSFRVSGLASPQRTLSSRFTAEVWHRVALELRNNSELFAGYLQRHLAGGAHTAPVWLATSEESRRCRNYCTLVYLDAQPEAALHHCLSKDCPLTTGARGDSRPTEEDPNVSLTLTLAVILGFCTILIAISLVVNKAFCRRRRQSRHLQQVHQPPPAPCALETAPIATDGALQPEPLLTVPLEPSSSSYDYLRM